MINNIYTKLFSNSILYNVAYTIILILPAILNGYPIVYSDTSTYLASGFELEMPFDRPITYGIFIRLFSLNGLSLWTVIFSQTYILVYLVNQLLLKFNLTFKFFRGLIYYFLLIFTGIAWTCSQIMADIFTPILIISLFLLLFENGKKKYLYYFIFLVSSSMHLSHLGINILIIILLLLFKLIPLFKLNDFFSLQKILIVFFLMIVAFSTMLTPYSKSKHAFLFGAFIEHGIIKEYLNDNCKNHNYKICQYKDSFPKLAADFVWDKNSPFYKLGGFKETKTEFNEIIRNTLTSKKYLWLHFKEGLKATSQQIISFNMGDGNGPFIGETLLSKRVLQYFPTEYYSYITSFQNCNKLSIITVFNTIQNCFMALIFILIFLVMKTKKLSKQIIFINILFLSFILIHSASCGILANCANRYGCRVIWLLALLLIILYNSFKTNIVVKKKII